MGFEHVNFLAVAVAAIAAFALGSLWYSPVLFGKSWQKALGFTDEYIAEGNMGLIFGSTFVLMLVMSLGMALLIGAAPGEISIMTGVHYGLMIGIMFVGTSMAINMLYQRKPVKLWFIDAGYQIVFLVIMGVIIAAWR